MSIPSPLEPVVKWAGSKRPIAARLAAMFPVGYERYVEPFVGGGAMLRFRSGPSVAADVYSPLVALWVEIQRDPAWLGASYRSTWEELARRGDAVYYEVRDRFNTVPNPDDFLFLTRTCYGGLFRLSKGGRFNVAFHHGRPGLHPDRMDRVLGQWHEAVRGCRFVCGDYAVHRPAAGDFWFMDPPYHWGNDSDFGFYQGAFDHPRFCLFLDALSAFGVKWMLTLDPASAEMAARGREVWKSVVGGPPSAHSRLRSAKKSAVDHAVLTNYDHRRA